MMKLEEFDECITSFEEIGIYHYPMRTTEARKFLSVAKAAKLIAHNFREIQKSKYWFDFTPNIEGIEEALEELEKDE